MASDENVWIPLLSTIAGGAIAFVSVYLAGRQQNTMTLKKERLERRLSKAEELYSLILKFEQEAGCWRLAIIEDDHDYLDTGLGLPQHEIHKIGLIVHIHLPELGNLGDHVLEKELKFGRLVSEWLDKSSKQKKTEHDIEPIEAAYGELREATNKLKKAISNVVKNN